MFYLTTYSTHFIYGYMASERYDGVMSVNITLLKTDLPSEGPLGRVETYAHQIQPQRFLMVRNTL